MRDRLRPIFFPSAGRHAAITRDQIHPIPPRRLVRRPFPRVHATVSVVLPTFDAGPLFGRVLAALAAQTGVDGIELIVIDSGSTDGTPERAEAAGARVIPIAREAFGHGRTRNLGAEAASGDILLMLVQDAVLLGRDAVRGLAAELLATETTAAVSARQIPRSDADLFGAFVVVTHDRVMRNASLPGSRVPPALERRAGAAMDNVCAVLRRDVWEELRFADIRFAEDLEFGLRARARGWDVKLSRNSTVAHSHARDAAYQLRRSVADRLHVAPLVGDLPNAATGPVETVSGDARNLLGQIQASTVVLDDIASLSAHIALLRRSIGESGSSGALDGALATLAASLPAESVQTASKTGLLEDFRALLGWPPLIEFASANSAVSRDDFMTFATKLAATTIGNALGDALRQAGRTDATPELLVGV